MSVCTTLRLLARRLNLVRRRNGPRSAPRKNASLVSRDAPFLEHGGIHPFAIRVRAEAQQEGSFDPAAVHAFWIALYTVAWLLEGSGERCCVGLLPPAVRCNAYAWMKVVGVLIGMYGAARVGQSFYQTFYRPEST